MRLRVALVAAGVVLIAYAVLGALTDAEADPAGIAVFLIAVLVGHDALWMPLVLLVIAAVPAVRAVIRKKTARPPAPGDGYRDRGGT